MQLNTIIDNNLIIQLQKCTKNTPLFSLKGKKLLAKCVDVYDGDTCTLALFINYPELDLYSFHVRLKGYDSPEIRTKNLEEKKEGIHCRDVLRELILEKIVVAEFDKADKYGRCLAKIYIQTQTQTQTQSFENLENNGIKHKIRRHRKYLNVMKNCLKALKLLKPAKVKIPVTVDTFALDTDKLLEINQFMLNNTVCYSYNGGKRKNFFEYANVQEAEFKYIT